MKDRIAHIMRAKNLKASDFAEMLGIQPSGISHILSGRNQPSLDFVKKIKETFPEYNLDWIIFGKGPMTTSEPFRDKQFSATSTAQENFIAPEIPFTPTAEPVKTVDQVPASEPNLFSNLSKSNIKSMFVVYDDGTFETYSPR